MAPTGVTMYHRDLSVVSTTSPLEAPLTFRRADKTEAGALAALLARAYEGEYWDEAGTKRELFDDETVKVTLVIATQTGVLTAARQLGCREARLHTETDRLAAISLYLQLGFEPFVTDDSEHEVWVQVTKRLGAGAD